MRMLNNHTIRKTLLLPLLMLVSITAQALLPAEKDWQHAQWKDLDKFHNELGKHGYINKNTVLNQYLNSTLKRLNANKYIEAYVLNDPEVNAMALPNGRIYINLGLVVLANSDSQLASVIAHEMAHIQLKHGEQVRERERENTKSQFWANSVGFGIGGAAVGIITKFKRSNFSVEQEKEADAKGLNALKNAHYNAHGMPSMFKRMREYTKDLGDKEDSYFKTHPELLERAEAATTTLSKYTYTGKNRNYTPIRQTAVNEFIDWALDNNQYSVLIFNFQNQQFADFKDTPPVLYGIGKAYQQRKLSKKESKKQWKIWKRKGIKMDKPKTDDISQAIVHFEKTLAKAPNHVDANYDLATLYVQMDKSAQAQPLFKRFIELSQTDDKRREFAAYYLQ